MPRNGGAGAETPRSKPQSPLRITHHGEFYARLLSKETSSLGNPSFRYYGAGPGAVPFVWESHPGTPKDAHSGSATAAVVPAAITPPPSFHLRAAAHGRAHGRHGSRRRASKYCGAYNKLNKWIKVGFIATVFRRLAFGGKPTTRSSSPAAASAKSSSTRWLFSGHGAAEARDDQREYEPPTTTMLCLRVRPSPWMLQFWGGGRREPAAGWVYGLRRP